MRIFFLSIFLLLSLPVQGAFLVRPSLNAFGGWWDTVYSHPFFSVKMKGRNVAYTFSTTFAYEHRFFIAGLDFHIGSQKWIYNQDATLVHDDDWVNASAKNKMWGGVFAFVVPQKKMELKMWLGYYPYNKLEFTAPFNPDDQIPLYRGKSYRIGLTFQKKKSMVSWSLDYYRHVFDERSEGGDNADLPGRNQGNSHEKLKSHAIAVSFSWPISLFGGKRRRR